MTQLISLEVVLLALDPALHKSGAAILIPDYGGLNEPEHAFNGDYVLHEFGKVTTQRERERYVDELLDMADDLGIPPVIVAEVWDGPRNKKGLGEHGEAVFVPDKKWNYKTILGMGEGWGRWSAEIEHANACREEDKNQPILVERVTPNDWRDAVFGARRARDSAQLKATARRYFKGVFGYDNVSDDIAEAGCIGIYGLHSTFLAAGLVALAAQRPPPKKPTKKRKRK